jgi:hypothetical protein
VASGFENVKRFQLKVIAQQYATIYNAIKAAHEQA